MRIQPEQPQKSYCRKCGEVFWTEVMVGTAGNLMREKAAELCLACWLEGELEDTDKEG